MRPASLELVPYSLRFRDLYVTARGQLSEREILLIRIRDADGAEGLGEATPLSLRGGPGVAQVAREVEEVCWPLVEGRELELTSIPHLLAVCRSRGASLQAIAAVDLGLHDLAGKLAGEPVWKLLGAERADPVRCNATLPAANPSALRRLAGEWKERGFRTFKLKVGVAGDVQQVAHVREAAGPEIELRVDANASWDAATAVERLQAMDEQRLEIVEQPCSGLEDLAEVRRRTHLRISGDESVIDAADARRAAQAAACDIAAVKLSKAGGLLGTLAVAAEMPAYLSSALDGPVGIAAAFHAAQAVEDAGAAHGLATLDLFSDVVAASGPLLDGDLLTVPEAPGLGVEIDPAMLEARRP